MQLTGIKTIGKMTDYTGIKAYVGACVCVHVCMCMRALARVCVLYHAHKPFVVVVQYVYEY